MYVSTWFTLCLCLNFSPFNVSFWRVRGLFSVQNVLKFSRFNFYSFDNVYSGLFGCPVFGWVGCPFSKVNGSFWIKSFYLLIFDAASNVFLPCWSFNFLSLQGQKPTFLYYCSDLISEFIVWKLECSCQISSILFLYALFVGLLLK